MGEGWPCLTLQEYGLNHEALEAVKQEKEVRMFLKNQASYRVQTSLKARSGLRDQARDCCSNRRDAQSLLLLQRCSNSRGDSPQD